MGIDTQCMHTHPSLRSFLAVHQDLVSVLEAGNSTRQLRLIHVTIVLSTDDDSVHPRSTLFSTDWRTCNSLLSYRTWCRCWRPAARGSCT